MLYSFSTTNSMEALETADSTIANNSICSSCSNLLEIRDKIIHCEFCSKVFHASEMCIALPYDVIPYLLKYENSGLLYKCVKCREQQVEFGKFFPMITNMVNTDTEDQNSNFPEIIEGKTSIKLEENEKIDVLPEVRRPRTILKNLSTAHSNEFKEKPKSANESHKKKIQRKQIASSLKNSSVIACKYCSYCTSSAMLFKKHFRSHKIKGPFKCVSCAVSFSREDALERHKLIHTSKEFYCDLCSKSFLSKSSLDKHIKLAHSTQKPFNCETCKKAFIRKESLKKHRRIHTAENVYASEGLFKCKRCAFSTKYKATYQNHLEKPNCGLPLKCDICGITYSRPEALEIHKAVHTTEKLIDCETCNKQFHSEIAYDKHKEYHSVEKPFKCDVCGLRFRREDRLKTHSKVHDAERQRYACNFCDRLFMNSASRNAHMRTHTGEKLICELCNYSCNKKGDLATHLLDHTGEKPFKCNICSFATKYKEGVARHVKIIHEGFKPFKCHICDFATARKIALTNHVRTHTGEKPFKCHLCDFAGISNNYLKVHLQTAHEVVKRHKCQYCNYSTHTKFTFNIHLRTHTGEKPFSCHYCSHMASSKRHLQIHIRTHTGEKPYKCDFCDYTAVQRSSLTSHIKNRHNNKLENCSTDQAVTSGLSTYNI